MTKLLILSALALLATPALADPSPTLQVGFKVDGGKDQRHYTVKLVDKACGSVSQKTVAPVQAVRDEIKVCAHTENGAVRLQIEWQLHDKDRDIENKSEMVIVRGTTQELDGGSAKLTVALI